MDYSSDWFLELIRDFGKNNANSYDFISDWNFQMDEVIYPQRLLNIASKNAQTNSSSYSFAEDQQDKKVLIESFLSRNNITVPTHQITIVGSATAALYASLLSLRKINVKKFLVLTPVYYTVLDTLKENGAEVHFFHLIDEENFRINFANLIEEINKYQIECIVITDPIYSSGIEIPVEDYRKLVDLSNEKDFWILNDYSLGGLLWNTQHQQLLSTAKMESLLNTEKFIIIESLTKKLLVNGVKSAFVIARKDLIPIIENYISQFYGGFCSMQLALFEEIYSLENTKEIESILNKNTANIKSNYELLTSVLRTSKYSAYPSNSGFFTIVAHKDFRMEEVDSKSIIKEFLYKENVYAIPSFHFSFFQKNKFGFRVNLLLNSTSTMIAIKKCIGIDIEPFKQR